MPGTTTTETEIQFEATYLEREEGAAGMRALVERHGGQVLEEKPLEKIRLAYPVKKQAYAFMGSLRFTMAPEALREFQADLRLNHEALRTLVHRASRIPSRGASAEETAKPAPANPPAGGRGIHPAYPQSTGVLTNEALEKKIEEILQ